MRISRLLVVGLSTLLCAGSAVAEPGLEKAEGAEKSTAVAMSARPEVARAVITSAVQDREPVDQVFSIQNDQPIIYFFTELLNLEGATVTHRWERDGMVMGEVPFTIGSPRWRVWSSKNLEPSWTGEWTASVIGSTGEVLESVGFSYTAVKSQESTTPPAKLD